MSLKTEPTHICILYNNYFAPVPYICFPPYDQYAILLCAPYKTISSYALFYLEQIRLRFLISIVCSHIHKYHFNYMLSIISCLQMLNPFRHRFLFLSLAFYNQQHLNVHKSYIIVSSQIRRLGSGIVGGCGRVLQYAFSCWAPAWKLSSTK